MIITKTGNNVATDTQDKKISVALMASFVVLTVQYFILLFFNLIGTDSGSLIQLMSKILVGAVYIYALPVVLRRNLNKFIGIYSVAIVIILIHYTIFPENREYLTDLLFPLLFMSIPSFIFALSVCDLEVFKTTMKKAASIVFVFGFIIGILVFLGKISVGTYSMSLSYYMLLPTIIYADEFIDKFSLGKLVLAGLSLLIILALGSRGAVLCVVVFVLLKLIRPGQKITYKRALGHTSVIGAGVLIVMFFEEILSSLYNILLGFGINSRSLLLFSSEDVSLSGRDNLYEMVLDEIGKSPLLGIGLKGDTRIIGNSYVHNIFIEIIGNFGIILGSALWIGIIVLIIKALLTKDKLRYNLSIIWLSLGFVPLVVSGSYLSDLKFWILLGLLINFSLSEKRETSVAMKCRIQEKTGR